MRQTASRYSVLKLFPFPEDAITIACTRDSPPNFYFTHHNYSNTNKQQTNNKITWQSSKRIINSPHKKAVAQPQIPMRGSSTACPSFFRRHFTPPCLQLNASVRKPVPDQRQNSHGFNKSESISQSFGEIGRRTARDQKNVSDYGRETKRKKKASHKGALSTFPGPLFVPFM